jgi:hypothetical protein
MPKLHNDQQVDHKCKCMPLDISMLKISSCILKCKTIILNTPICYTKYHTINKYIFQKLLMLANSDMLMLSGCDNTIPLGI